MARCSQIEPELQAYIDGELSRSKELIVEEHLSACMHCKQEFEILRKSNAYLYESLSPYKLNESLDEQIMKKLPEIDISYNQTHQITLRVKHQDESPYSFSNIFPYLALTAMTVLGVFIFVSWPHREISESQKVGIAINMSGNSSIINNNINNIMKEEDLTPIKTDNYIETKEDSIVYTYLKGNSILKLAEKTRIRILDERTVNLEKGKVLFDIGKDKKVFRVNTPQGIVTVFGTQFQVEVDSTQILTTVHRGEVTVETAHQFVVLKQNQQVLLKGNTFASEVKTCDSNEIIAWSRNIEPSERILQKISNIFGNSESILIATPASQVFVVPTQMKEISSLVLFWDKQKII
ncbi:MAG: FecR domain-containing protein, partial [Candidatus Hydrogenedens sp.]